MSRAERGLITQPLTHGALLFSASNLARVLDEGKNLTFFHFWYSRCKLLTVKTISDEEPAFLCPVCEINHHFKLFRDLSSLKAPLIPADMEPSLQHQQASSWGLQSNQQAQKHSCFNHLLLETSTTVIAEEKLVFTQIPLNKTPNSEKSIGKLQVTLQFQQKMKQKLLLFQPFLKAGPINF